MVLVGLDPGGATVTVALGSPVSGIWSDGAQVLVLTKDGVLHAFTVSRTTSERE